jgi:hypothetical protein
MISGRFLFPVVLLVMSPMAGPLAGQSTTKDSAITISVGDSTPPKQVQMRYYLGGDSEGLWSATTSEAEGNKIVVKADRQGGLPKTFKGIAYVPGCRFFTISIDDVTTNRQEIEFRCQTLATREFRGRFDRSGFQQKDLKVEVLYNCHWAAQFFGLPGSAVSPFFLAKGSVASDGSFEVDLPDFASDPLWESFSQDATLLFFVSDGSSGERLNSLKSPNDLSVRGALKVASGYPAEVEFNVEPEGLRSAK